VQAAVKLFEHPDFEQAVIRAAEAFPFPGLRKSIIERTTSSPKRLPASSSRLREISSIFKGGTSLSKGWGSIERFSEERGHLP
jgi:hypothetical protein